MERIALEGKVRKGRNPEKEFEREKALLRKLFEYRKKGMSTLNQAELRPWVQLGKPTTTMGELKLPKTTLV